MPHRLFIYEFANVQNLMVQSGDEIIYFSRQPDDFFHQKADQIIYLQKHPTYMYLHTVDTPQKYLMVIH